jgi:chromosome segregation ATPase
MTKLGKALVLFNLVLSVVFVAWGIGLITNEVPWSTPQSTDGIRVQGMVKALEDEIKRLTPGQQAADARWADAYVELQQLENQRPTNQRYYADLLNSVRRGGVQGIDPPVQQLEFQGNQLVLKRTGRKVLEINGQELTMSVDQYVRAIQDKIKEIQKAQDDVKTLNAQTDELTILINGTKPRGQAVTAAEKGLRVQLAELEEMIKGLQLEEQYLRSPLTYLTLQVDQLRRRQAALAARLDELSRVDGQQR